MNGNRFASITSSLLTRKGEALPSSLDKTPLDWHAPAHLESYASHFGSNHHHHHADAPLPHHGAHDEDHPYLRKIQVGLTDGDHEKLRIVAARQEISRQDAVREALKQYFEKIGHEYRDQCHCLSGAGPCARNCAS